MDQNPEREWGDSPRRSGAGGVNREVVRISRGNLKYDYAGNGSKLLTTFEIGPSGRESIYYDDDFRIDPTEHYVALDQGYQQSTEALVIKDLMSLKDLFTLPLSEIAKQNPKVLGALSFVNGGWSQDGRYVWLQPGVLLVGFCR